MNKKTLTTLLSIGLTTSILVFGMTFVSHEALAQVKNPLGSQSLSGFIAGIIKFLLGLVASVGLMFFVIGGVTLITSGGNDEKVKKGQQTLFWATVGVVLALASYFIVNFVIQSVTSI